MEYRMTPAMRPVCKLVNEAIGELPSGPFNYGLYFQKWFYVSTQTRKCVTDDQRRKEKYGISLIDNMETSLRLFNGESISIQNAMGSWDTSKIIELLNKKHLELDQCAKAFKKLGYEYYKEEVSLLTPLVVGLGNEHPTEKGFRFDWSLGIPIIPSSSVKGVVRLAHLVEELNQCPEKAVEEFWNEIVHGKLRDAAQDIFGCGEVKDSEKETKKNETGVGSKNQIALRGKVIFLDAYPATLPKLKPEIMNCHYPDYFSAKPGKDNRGPTEDQQPNPQKYWAVDPYLDKKSAPLKFIFRFLLHKDIASNEAYREGFEKALKAALEEHGLGAKTAIGHGRFSQKSCVSDSQQDRTVTGEVKQETSLSAIKPEKPDPQTKIWQKATLTWNPGNSTATATLGTLRATVVGRELIPEIFHKKLFEKRKSVTARVEVEPAGNAFKIVRIEPDI